MALYTNEIKVTLDWEWQETRQQILASPSIILYVRVFKNDKNEWEEIGRHYLHHSFNIEEAEEIIKTIISDYERELAEAAPALNPTNPGYDPDFDSVF